MVKDAQVNFSPSHLTFSSCVCLTNLDPLSVRPLGLASSEADAGEARAVVCALFPVHSWALAESRERRSIIVCVRLGHVIDEDFSLLATR